MYPCDVGKHTLLSTFRLALIIGTVILQMLVYYISSQYI